MTEQQHSADESKRRHHNYKTTVDAEFLETIDQTSSVLDLHRSNLLRLQVEQLLQECSLQLDASQPHVKWAATAHEYVAYISRIVEQVSLTNVIYDKKSPFARLSDKTIDSVHSSQKLQVDPAGCFAANLGLTTLQGNANVLPTLDLKVKIPNDLFENKDYLRNRYFDKRNLIVWYVANILGLKKFKSTVGKVYWRYHHADHRKPVLLLIPPTSLNHPAKSNPKKKQKSSVSKTKKLRFRIQLDFGMESIAWIPLLRLVPNRCNLMADSSSSSQFYNHALTEDASHEFEGLVNGNKEDYPHWNEATILAKIWCLQRGLLRSHDGFTTEQLALLILYLFRTKQANPRMGAIQVLTALFKLLAETDWLGEKDTSIDKSSEEASLLRMAPSEAYQDIQRKPTKRAILILPEEGKTVNQTVASSTLAQFYAQQTRESPLTPNDPATLSELYSRHFHLGPVFLDPTMIHNYLGRLSPAFMRIVQREARKSVECMHSEVHARPFPYLFMTEARFWTRYDAYLQVSLSDVVFDSKLWGQDRKDVGDYESIARGVVEVLRKALGDRVNAVGLLSTGNGLVKDSIHSVNDADETPLQQTLREGEKFKDKLQSPTGRDTIVMGLSLNPDTCYRTVDRGPPADSSEATQAFLDLWGSSKAELRRFKDGAIVYAVVWSTAPEKDEQEGEDQYVHFQNDDKMQGGIVERIVRHIFQLHFLKKTPKSNVPVQFSLRNMLSCVDGVRPTENSAETTAFNPVAAHRMAMIAFDSLATFLRKHSAPTLPVAGSSEMKSRLGIPLAIDAVEPLSPTLRYAEIFPPVPHPLLGSAAMSGAKKASGAVQTDPIEIQIRFGATSKWPTDLKAMGAAKTAMLIQVANGIEEMKKTGREEDVEAFDGQINVTPAYADVAFKGFVFRIYVRADPELKLLHSLVRPSPDAVMLLCALTRKHVVASKHHSMVHAVYTRHPSSGFVTRMAKRWVSSHLLSGLIPFEAIELLVAHVYTDKASPIDAPATVVSGFLRFLRLLASHDWARAPMIVDPQGQLTDDDCSHITAQFEKARSAGIQHGPAMFIVSPNDRNEADDGTQITPGKSPEPQSSWVPSFTAETPELVALTRAVALAQRSYSFLRSSLVDFKTDDWSAVFHESTSSFLSYSVLLRVDPDFLVDAESSSTGGSLGVRIKNRDTLVSSFSTSMQSRFHGPKVLRRKLYRNLIDSGENQMLLEWRPVDDMVQALRTQLGPLAVFFYNDLCPEVVAILWRPVFASRSFSAMGSEHVRPIVADGFQSDTLVTINTKDILREVSQYTSDIVVGVKLFGTGPEIAPAGKRKLSDGERSAEAAKSSGSDSDSDSE